jgi:hypothetical protein
MVINVRQTYIVPKANRLALMQQPNSPVKSVASTHFPQADSAVVELAIVLSVIRASGCILLAISLTGSLGR